MTIKDIWTKVCNLGKNSSMGRGLYPVINEQGLISDDSMDADKGQAQVQTGVSNKQEIVKKTDRPAPIERKENIEVFSKAFNKLIDQLQGINEHLNKQVAQHEKLTDRIDQLPNLLENLPASVRDQKQLVNELIEQLKGKALKEQQFVDIVGEIPAQTSKQTDKLIEINQKLSASADADVQMAESFNRFNETLGKLDGDTISQTDSIDQLKKTFATSDRYLKYIISKQHKRFMWVFITAMSVCVLAILALVVTIVIAMNK